MVGNPSVDLKKDGIYWVVRWNGYKGGCIDGKYFIYKQDDVM
jgi:hypothetical protein